MKGWGLLLITLPSIFAFGVLLFSNLTDPIGSFRISMKIALLPFIGYSILLYALSNTNVASRAISKFSIGKSVIKWISLYQIVYTIFCILSIDWFLMDDKVAGGYFVYPIFVQLGILFLIESAFIYYVCNLHNFERKDIEDDKGKWIMQVTYKKAKAYQKNRNILLFTIIGVISIIFLLVFLPPLHVVSEGPDIEIHKSEGEYIIRGPKANRTITGLNVNIVIVNNGGIEATGTIEVRLHNETFNQTLDTTNKVKGFGLWRIERVVLFNSTWYLTKKENPKLDYFVSLVHNEKIVDIKKLEQIPNPCSIGLIILVMAVVTIWRSYRQKKWRTA
jgi:hypothetical protein